MAEEADLSSFDLRYESYRLRNPTQEARVLFSITERGQCREGRAWRWILPKRLPHEHQSAWS